MSKKIIATVSHHEREVSELRADRELAVEYMKPLWSRSIILMTVQLDSLGYARSPKLMAGLELLLLKLDQPGNTLSNPVCQRYPTLKTLLVVLKAVGMKLSVEPKHHAAA